MRLLVLFCVTWSILSVLFVLFSPLGKRRSSKSTLSTPSQTVAVSYDKPDDFVAFDNVSGTQDGCFIVPNLVHFLRFSKPEFSFVDAVCVLAAFKNQKPDKIIFHTNSPNFRGKYWNVLLSVPGLRDVIRLKLMRIPTHIYGQPLSVPWRKFHGGDVARINILMEHGGIFLDNDSYIVRSLDEFRRFEMTLGWKVGGNISNQVVVAHRNARFLREWLLSYKGHYKAKSWFFNAGIRPTQEVLTKRPELIHRVPKRFAEFHGIPRLLYLTRTTQWRDHYAIHLLINHQYMLKTNLSTEATYPVIFDDINIKKYPTTFRDMVDDVYPFDT